MQCCKYLGWCCCLVVIALLLFGGVTISYGADSGEIVPQSGEGSDIRTRFNDDADKVRLMVLLSPT